jgi:hypothetical protein
VQNYVLENSVATALCMRVNRLCCAPAKVERLRMLDTVTPPGRLGHQLWRLVPYLRAERVSLFGIILLSTSSAGLAAFEPWILKRLFHGFVSGLRWSALLWPFASLVALLAAKEILSAVFERIFWCTRLAINFTLLQATVERLHSLPLQYHRECRNDDDRCIPLQGLWELWDPSAYMATIR